MPSSGIKKRCNDRLGVWGPDNKGPDKKDNNELYDFELFPQYMYIDWVRIYQQDGEQGAAPNA